MCGIAGAVASGEIDPGMVLAMCSRMRHRGPDSEGVWRDRTGRCCLGHRRLAILDLSAAAYQPMLSKNGRYAITFNGEIYNYLALRAQLADRGVEFDGTSDTEVLVEWLSDKGVDGIKGLRGMFAFGLWDMAEATLWLARDPLGIKPCYYSRGASGSLAFASELKALVAAGAAGRSADVDGVASYLAFGCVQGPGTMIEGIREVPPGHLLKLDVASGKCDLRAYATHSYPRGGVKGLEYRPDEFAEGLDAAVASHLVSDVPIGAFLSGGVDSSAIVAAMVDSGARDVRTLCVVLPSREGREDADIARRVAERLGTHHTAIVLSDEDLRERIREGLGAMDQPTIDALNTYIVSHAARSAGLTVALSGLGGDELFGGYGSFEKIPRYAMIRDAAGAVGTYLARLAIRGISGAGMGGRKTARALGFLLGEGGVCGVYDEYYRNFSRAEVGWLLGSGPGIERRSFGRTSMWPRLVEECSGLEDLDAVSWLELTCHMGSSMLRDTDTMSMACSLEVRVPLLDWNFVGYAQRLGAGVRRAREKKRVLVEAMGRRLPASLFERRKVGFWMPMDEILRVHLRSEVLAGIGVLDDTLLDGRGRGLWEDYERAPSGEGWKRVWTIAVLGGWVARNGVDLSPLRASA